jgi:acetolactate synthase I/II/III large subunit
MKSISRIIAEHLRDYGVEDVFMVTGGGAMFLNDAFSSTEGLKVTYFHHEQAAAMAAESYYRLIKKPVILNVTTGPGAINAINGVYGAYVDSCAIIVISGQVKLETFKGVGNESLRQLGDQEVDIISMVKGVVKKTYFLDNPDNIFDILDDSIKVIDEGRPGPIWIDVPVDVSSMEIDENKKAIVIKEDKFRINSFTDIDSSIIGQVKELITLIQKSKSPSILLGNGIHFSGSREKIYDLVETLSIPVLTGWNAHDTFLTSHRMFCGKPGTVGDRGGNIVLHNSDLLIVLGNRLNIRQISYNYRQLCDNRKVVYVDIDQSELNKGTINPYLKIQSDLYLFIEVMMRELSNYQPNSRHLKFLSWSKNVYLNYKDYNEPLILDDGLNPYMILQQFFNEVREGEIIVTGNATAAIVAFQTAIIKEGTRIFSNSGSASMGYGLPAAIGASLANRGSRVILFTGDGSIMQNIQELQLIKHLNLPIKIIILNNDGYLSIKQTQMNFFPKNQHGYDSSNGISFPDYVKVSNAFGINAKLIQDKLEWETLIKVDIYQDGPIVANVMISNKVDFHPKLSAYVGENGSLISPTYNKMSPIIEINDFFYDD